MTNKDTSLPRLDEFGISTERARLDVDWIRERLSTDAYWAPGRTRARVEKSLDNSMCYGVYHPDGYQVAIARVVTDFAVFAWLGDVYVDREFRGMGVGKRLMEHIMNDLDGMSIRRAVLSTADAEGLYERYGFTKEIDKAGRWMIKTWPENP